MEVRQSNNGLRELRVFEGVQEGGDGMSVLVKGMEMPRNCYECKVWFQCFDEKPPFNMIKSVCPLIDVKEPHGRLIDADELKTAFPRCDNSMDIKIASVRATINHAPTVIEGGEE